MSEGKRRYQEPVPETDIAEFRKVVESRRSVRRFTDEPLPEAVLQDCLDLAMLAPNSSNLQPWSFHIVRTPAIREGVVTACLNQNAARTAQALVAVVARTDTWREHSDLNITHWPLPVVPAIVDNYYRRYAKFHYGAGPLGLKGWFKKAFFALVGLKRPVPRGPYTQAEMNAWAVKSTALAAENFMLAMRAHGYDTCPMEGFDERRLRRLLKLPRGAIITMIIGAGRRAPDGVYHPRIRFNRERFIHDV